MLGSYLQQTTFSDAFFTWHFKGTVTNAVCPLICFGTLLVYIANSMDPDHTTPFGAV